jgi:hypothetical protein
MNWRMTTSWCSWQPKLRTRSVFGRLDETAHFFPSQHALKKTCSVTFEKALANRFRQVFGCRSSRLRRHAKAFGCDPACRTSGAENRIQEMKGEIDRLPILNLSDDCRSSTRNHLITSRWLGLRGEVEKALEEIARPAAATPHGPIASTWCTSTAASR